MNPDWGPDAAEWMWRVLSAELVAADVDPAAEPWSYHLDGIEAAHRDREWDRYAAAVRTCLRTVRDGVRGAE